MRADIERQKPARARAGQIRSGITNYIHTLGVIAQAYQERDWETLGYESWQQYVDGEFPAARLGIPAEYREKAMVDLRLAGLSTRAIAPVVGVHHSTVARQVSQDATPEPIQGVDGKTYSPARSPLVEALTGAIEDATERAQTAGLAGPAPAEEDRRLHTSAGTAAAGDRVDAPAAAPDHPGSSSPGEGADSPPAPAAGGTATTPPPAAPNSPPEPAAPGEAAEGQGGPATSPAGPPCEKCGGEIEQAQDGDRFMRCADCDPDGEHVAADDGRCQLCTAVEAVPDTYLPFDIAAGTDGLYLRCTGCAQLTAHLKPGTVLALALVEVGLHRCQ